MQDIYNMETGTGSQVITRLYLTPGDSIRSILAISRRALICSRVIDMIKPVNLKSLFRVPKERVRRIRPPDPPHQHCNHQRRRSRAVN